MIKNLTSTQLLLIAIATIVLLIAAFSLFLLQDPSAPLPFAPLSVSSTATPPLPADTAGPLASDTPLPTRQTSYTPFATLLTPGGSTPATPGDGTLTPVSSEVTQQSGATQSPTSTRSAAPGPSSTSAFTVTPATPGFTPTPTVTETLAAGETGVTGRVTLSGTPLANVHVEFKDDVAPRKSSTNPGGHYWFVTLAPGTAFYLVFRLGDNSQLTPPADITYLARVEGNLPSGVDIIDLPDIELSLVQDGSHFEQQGPDDGTTYSASAISATNLVPFEWNSYNGTTTYRIELGLYGSDQPSWTSPLINDTNYMWDGTLTDGTHVSANDYWWRVAAVKTSNGYTTSIFTHPWDLSFDP